MCDRCTSTRAAPAAQRVTVLCAVCFCTLDVIVCRLERVTVLCAVCFCTLDVIVCRLERVTVLCAICFCTLDVIVCRLEHLDTAAVAHDELDVPFTLDQSQHQISAHACHLSVGTLHTAYLLETVTGNRYPALKQLVMLQLAHIQRIQTGHPMLHLLTARSGDRHCVR